LTETPATADSRWVGGESSSDLVATVALTAASCFDPALAEFPTQVLALDRVVDLLHISHAPERITAYRQAMLHGARFPPIAVVRVAGRYMIADGHKRFSAYKSLPVTEILVEVWTTRRWLQDQWRQFAGKTAQQVRTLFRSPIDSTARRQARRLFWDTTGHWARITRSMWRQVRNRPRG
jgi:ParB-like nuclease family protein